jgi:hypothetical protein
MITPEPNPEDMLYILDGARLQSIEEVAQSLGLLIDAASERPDLIHPDIAAVLTAGQNALGRAIADLGIYHDPRWADDPALGGDD